MFDEIVSKISNRDEDFLVIDRRKRSMTLNEVEPVKNINKNLQSFLELNLIQKKVLPSHKLQDHSYD